MIHLNFSSSLEKLTSYLDKDELWIIQHEFFNLSAENFDLLTRKDIFPYEYIDCIEKLEKAELPLRESFYSSLTGGTVSESDCAHAVKIGSSPFEPSMNIPYIFKCDGIRNNSFNYLLRK